MAQANGVPYPRRILNAALQYHEFGWKVIPVPYKQKGLQRAGWNKNVLETEEAVRAAFSLEVMWNLGVILGNLSGNLVDVDLDVAQAAAVADVLLPPTATFGREGKPRSHRIYRTIDWSTSTKPFKDPLTGETMVERRGDGVQTIFPPSHHVTGEPITWEDNSEIHELTREALDTLISKVAAAVVLAKHWPRGGRHYTALALAGWLVRHRWSEDDVASFVLAVAKGAGDEEAEDRARVARETVVRFAAGEEVTGYPTLVETVHERVLKAVAKWLDIRAHKADTTALGMNDVANVERFAARHGRVAKYCPEFKQWFTWNGKYWEEDVAGRVYELVKETHKSIYLEAAVAKTREEREALAAWAVASENLRQIESAVKLARTREDLVVRVDELDPDPWLFNVRNGTIDLRTGELKRHDPDDMITRMAPVDWSADAEMPLISAMIRESLEDRDGTLLAFLSRAVGITLYGGVEKAVFVLFGPTNTGKTTFLTKMLQSVMGPYAVQIVADAVNVSRRSEATMWMAELKGARLAVLSEPPQGLVLDASFVKAATGGNVQKGRRLFGMPFEFVPTATIWIDTNYRPEIPDHDDAIWNRLKPVHFKAQVKRVEGEEGFIRDFDAAIARERTGFLKWAVQGCLDWQKEGLGDPPAVRMEREEYKDDQNALGDFFTSEMLVNEEFHSPLSGDDSPWTRYQQYADRLKLDRRERMGKQRFNDFLESLGFRRGLKREGTSTVRVWFGLKVRPRRDESNFDVHGGLKSRVE